MALVEVEILLPDGSKKSGRLDPDASLKDMKDSIIEAYLPNENPNRYEMAIVPRSENTPEGYKISSGDAILIVEAKVSRGPVFIPDSD